MKNTVRKFFILFLMSALTFLSSGVQAKDTKVIELNFANFYSPTHLVSKAFEKWASELEKRTGGRVKVTFFHGASLAKMPETYDMIRTGSTETGSWLPTYQAALFPVNSAVNIPFTFEGPRQGGAAMWTFYESSPEMKSEYSKVKLIMLFTSDIKNIHTKSKPVNRLEDLKGLRIGCGAGLDVKVLTALGATPVQTGSLTDQYLALERGTVDGVYYPWAILKSLKITDLVKYHAVANLGILPVAVAMNLQQWAALPPDIQKVFTDLSHSASAFCGLTLEDYSNSIQEEEKKAGDEIYVVSHAELAQWTQAVQPIEAEWRETVKAKGMNPDAILGKLKQAAEKYRQSPYPPDEWWRK